MAWLLGVIEQMKNIVSEVSTTSKKLNAGVSQIGEVIVQIDQTTQKHVNLVGKTMTTTEMLRHQTTNFSYVVSAFSTIISSKNIRIIRINLRK